MLVVQDLGKNFGTHWAVKGFDAEIQEGEFVTLLGPSGSGKTTVLRMLAGLEQPSSGRILISGQDITHAPPQRRNMGLVFQSYALFPNMTVRENIAFPLRVRKWERSRIDARCDALLDLVGLQHRAKFLPHLLSGGERQRVALVRALAFHPPLLLLDEPLSALDAKVRESLRASLKEVQRLTGVTTLMVTHDQAEALELSDRVVVMNEGRIDQVGSPHDIYHYPTSAFTAAFIGHVNTLDVVVRRCRAVADKWLCTCEFGLHTFEWLLPEQVMEGSTQKLFVRPESIAISADSRIGMIPGVVEAVTFTGSVTRVVLRVAGQRWVVHMLSHGGQTSFPVGSTANVLPVDHRLSCLEGCADND